MQYIRADGDSCKEFDFSKIDSLLHLYLDYNIGVQISGMMPPNLETFSMKGVVIEADIDFTRCKGLTFLIYKQADVIFGDTDQLVYIKIGNEEALRGDSAKEEIVRLKLIADQSAGGVVRKMTASKDAVSV